MHRLTPAAMRAASAVLALGAILHAPHAAAQTAGYQLKEIHPPFLGSWTTCGAQYISDNGDVVGRCGTFAGLAFPSGWPVVYTAYRPIVWKAGSSSPVSLAVPSGQSAFRIMGIDAQGHVTAILEPTRGGSESLVTWNGAQRTTWPAPASLLDWYLSDGTTPGGKLAAASKVYSSTPGKLLIAGAGGPREMPPPPIVAEGRADIQSAVSGHMVHLNDRDQIALVTTEKNPDFEGPSRIRPRVWFWSGQAWREIVAQGGWLPANTVQVRDINKGGQVLLSEYAIEGTVVRDRRYLWSEAGGLARLPDDLRTYNEEGLHIVADNGDVLGQAQFDDVAALPAHGRYRAAVWRDGRMIDLNTLARPPSGFVFIDVQDVNAKGQLLVVMDSSSATSGSSRRRQVLLLPR